MRLLPDVPSAVRRRWSAAALAVVTLTACGPAPRWYRGNLHTHSYWSDGDQFPEVILRHYRERGYHFVALSDHNVLARTERWVTVDSIPDGPASLAEYRRVFGGDWVEQRPDPGTGLLQVRLKTFDEYAGRVSAPGAFLVMQAEEISDRFESRPLHLNATNLVEWIPPQGGTSVADVLQRNIDAVLAQRRATGQPMVPHVNHPNFGWAVTAEDLMDLEGERFFEVYNGHPLVHNTGDSLRPSTERIWDLVLAHRLTRGLPVMYGLAVDDAHNYGRVDSTRAAPGRGWIMVYAAALTAEAVLGAMEAGAFYASTGVTIEEIASSPNRLALRLAVEPGVTYETQFIGTRRGFDPAAEDLPDVAGRPVTRRYSDHIGAVLARVPGATPAYTFTGDELYVRARVVSSRPVAHPLYTGEVAMAWTQPVVPRAAR